MGSNQVAVEMLGSSVFFINLALGDLTDAEFLHRPVASANNGPWQLGHLIKSEAGMVNQCAGKTVVELPAGFTDRYKKDTTGSDDPAVIGTKTELLALFMKNREAVTKWAAGLSDEELRAAAPETLKKMCPTVGHVLQLLPIHVALHVGQWHVLRRGWGNRLCFRLIIGGNVWRGARLGC